MSAKIGNKRKTTYRAAMKKGGKAKKTKQKAKSVSYLRLVVSH